VPVLGITRRYVGTEPYSKTMRTYNAAMKSILTVNGVEVIEIERKAEGMDIEAHPNYISATKIRKALRDGDLDSVKDFLPPCTFAYLQSGSAKAVKAKLKEC
jgi:[citrate (pro-3S)-lyase] ligase